jgi:2-isopropylmalate synthase
VIAAGIPGANLGIHAHDDTGQAVANSLAAIEAGVRQIQGTLNGIGERCGNANLVTIIPTLALKPPFANAFETGISAGGAGGPLQAVAHTFDELLNRAPEAQAPYVGASAFATKAGIHASAIVKEPQTYEHVPPETWATAARSWCRTRAARRTSSPSSSGAASTCPRIAAGSMR